MKSTNVFNCIGRLGRDIELRYLANGDAVGSFSLALSDDYKKDGQKVEQTYWPRFVTYGKQAEALAQYVKKGDKVAVTAKYTSRKYNKDRQEREAIEFRVSDFELLSSRQEGGSQRQEPSRRAPTTAPADDEFSDDIPF